MPRRGRARAGLVNFEPFAIYERPGRTALLPRACTEEDGELTRNLKTKVRVVQANWADKVDYPVRHRRGQGVSALRLGVEQRLDVIRLDQLVGSERAGQGAAPRPFLEHGLDPRGSDRTTRLTEVHRVSSGISAFARTSMDHGQSIADGLL